MELTALFYVLVGGLCGYLLFRWVGWMSLLLLCFLPLTSQAWYVKDNGPPDGPYRYSLIDDSGACVVAVNGYYFNDEDPAAGITPGPGTAVESSATNVFSVLPCGSAPGFTISGTNEVLFWAGGGYTNNTAYPAQFHVDWGDGTSQNIFVNPGGSTNVYHTNSVGGCGSTTLQSFFPIGEGVLTGGPVGPSEPFCYQVVGGSGVSGTGGGIVTQYIPPPGGGAGGGGGGVTNYVTGTTNSSSSLLTELYLGFQSVVSAIGSVWGGSNGPVVNVVVTNSGSVSTTNSGSFPTNLFSQIASNTFNTAQNTLWASNEMQHALIAESNGDYGVAITNAVSAETAAGSNFLHAFDAVQFATNVYSQATPSLWDFPIPTNGPFSGRPGLWNINPRQSVFWRYAPWVNAAEEWLAVLWLAGFVRRRYREEMALYITTPGQGSKNLSNVFWWFSVAFFVYSIGLLVPVLVAFCTTLNSIVGGVLYVIGPGVFSHDTVVGLMDVTGNVVNSTPPSVYFFEAIDLVLDWLPIPFLFFIGVWAWTFSVTLQLLIVGICLFLREAG